MEGFSDIEAARILTAPEFKPFPKIPRLRRMVVVTEQIDGSNGCVYVPESPEEPILAGSKNRWIFPDPPGADNFGFAAWVAANAEALRGLGPGTHYGEWWGEGIGKRYPGVARRFSLFNTSRWLRADSGVFSRLDSDAERRSLQDLFPEATPPPACCDVVPVLGVLMSGELGELDTGLAKLRLCGSIAAPGCKAEGVILYHVAAKQFFKVTLEKDEEPKGKKDATQR